MVIPEAIIIFIILFVFSLLKIEKAKNKDSIYADLFITVNMFSCVSLQKTDIEDHIEKTMNILVILERFVIDFLGLIIVIIMEGPSTRM